MGVRRDGDVHHAGEPPRVEDLVAERLLRLGEERLGHEDPHLAAVRGKPKEARGGRAGRRSSRTLEEE
jgi:hypothetical protein